LPPPFPRKRTQFEGISIKVLYEDKSKGEMTCLLKWEPGATLPMHKHPEIEQTFVIEGSFYDHDGICRAGEFVWRRVGSFHETHSDEGAVILAVYRNPDWNPLPYQRSDVAIDASLGRLELGGNRRGGDRAARTAKDLNDLK
jgi:quercetin dioxygenase-like cupin family protein